MLLKINSDNPNIKKLELAIETLRNGGIIIFPTDTIYSFGVDINNKDGINKICKLKNLKPKEAHFSLICKDLREISKYTKQLDRPVYEMLNNSLPGPFTFILKATTEVTKIFNTNKKTIGIRVPENNISRELVEMLGNPIIATSVHHDDEIRDYITDPEEIFERYKHDVDIVIDGGMGDNEPSTVVDYTSETPLILRSGKGIINI